MLWTPLSPPISGYATVMAAGSMISQNSAMYVMSRIITSRLGTGNLGHVYYFMAISFCYNFLRPRKLMKPRHEITNSLVKRDRLPNQRAVSPKNHPLKTCRWAGLRRENYVTNQTKCRAKKVVDWRWVGCNCSRNSLWYDEPDHHKHLVMRTL